MTIYVNPQDSGRIFLERYWIDIDPVPFQNGSTHQERTIWALYTKNKIYREKSIPMIAWCPVFSNLG